MHIKVKSIIITLLFLFTVYTPAYATVYLNLNAEEGTVGATVPYPPFEAVNTSVARATYQSSGVPHKALNIINGRLLIAS